jgi:hypothetical protein
VTVAERICIGRGSGAHSHYEEHREHHCSWSSCSWASLPHGRRAAAIWLEASATALATRVTRLCSIDLKRSCVSALGVRTPTWSEEGQEQSKAFCGAHLPPDHRVRAWCALRDLYSRRPGRAGSQLPPDRLQAAAGGVELTPAPADPSRLPEQTLQASSRWGGA